MPIEHLKKQMQTRYHAELLKVGFSEDQASKIVADAADRLGADLDAPAQVQPVPTPKPAPAKHNRAVEVLVRKEYPVQRPLWNQIKQIRSQSIQPGGKFMDVMRELLSQDMKALRFSQTDIDYILSDP
jgi:hypothetical protein